EVAKKTDDVAGDGTTTATVLAQALVREGRRTRIGLVPAHREAALPVARDVLALAARG
ncbi:chaperonin GroEL, partial [Micromonospora sp. NPDC049799]